MLLILRSKKKIYKKMQVFNKKISDHFKLSGIDFDFASFEDIELFIENNKINLQINEKPLASWSTIFPRKVGKYYDLAHIIAVLSRKNKIFFIDKFYENLGDSSDKSKLLQMFKLSQAGLPVPKTYYCAVYTEKQIKNAIKFLSFPIVVKENNTSQGGGVSLAKNKKELVKILQNIINDNSRGNIFLQEFIPNNFEYRIFITGKVVGAVEKKIRTNKEEFRNNVFLGAKEEFLNFSEVKKTILDTALKASRATNIQVAGIDIVEKENGKLVIFEVNSCPGITVDEDVSPELKNLAKYLKKCEKK